MRIFITTQYLENYGFEDWDRKGECPQYWKAKGGCHYLLKEVPRMQVPRAIQNFKAFCTSKEFYAIEYPLQVEVLQDHEILPCEDWERSDVHVFTYDEIYGVE